MLNAKFILVLFLALGAMAVDGSLAQTPSEKVVYKAGLAHVPGLMFRNPDGTPGGFPCEILAAAARDEGIELEWVDGTWPELFNKLKAGEIDVLPGTQFSRERAQYLDYLSEGLCAMWGEMYLRKGTSFNGLDDLRNKRIGLVMADNNAAEFRKFIRGFEIPYHLVEFSSHHESIVALSKEEVYAIVGPQVALLGDLAKDLKRTGLVFNPTELSIAFPKGKAAELRKALDHRIMIYKANPNSTFYKQYRSLRESVLSPRREPIPPWVWTILVSMGSLLLLVLLFLALLRFQVRRATHEIRCGQVALRDREQNLATTLNSIGEGVLVADCDGIILRINPVAQALVGVSAERAIGLPLKDVLHILNPTTREPLGDLVAMTLAAAKPIKLLDRAILISRYGDEFWVSDSAAPILHPSGGQLGVVIVFRDVTADIHKEEQLLHSQKMDAIGQLAGGVAHDFNNALMGIMGFAELLAQSVSGEDESSYCHEIMTASKRAAQLTRQLLTFARKDHRVSIPIDVHTVILDSMRILKRSIDKSIAIETHLDAKRPVVLGDGSQLQSAIINLGINSRDAMPQGGIFAVSTFDVSLSSAQASALRETFPAGDYLRIMVRDTGEGMDEVTRRHVFEPFFTTKETGRGTGLGLSAVYGMIESHGGAVTLKSEVGKGTSFDLYLPLADADVVVPEDKLAARRPAHAAGTILLIEDEPAVRKVCEGLLSHMGYHVRLAEDGITGLELYQTHGEDIQAVLLDVMMPGINGLQVFRELRKMNSTVKIIIASGYADAEHIQQFEKTGADGFISKPYDRKTLADTLAKVLG